MSYMYIGIKIGCQAVTGFHRFIELLHRLRFSHTFIGLASSILTALNSIQNEQAVGSFIAANETKEPVDVEPPAHRDNTEKAKNFKIDLVMEMFNSFRSKPKKMLTFLCSQDFRRDQYCDHYLTAHADIQSGKGVYILITCRL